MNEIDHCDSCVNPMDGEVAATADVCHDCWQAANARLAAANAEIERLREEQRCQQDVNVAQAQGLKKREELRNAALRDAAAANALLLEAADGHEEDPDGNIGVGLVRRIRAHLAKAKP